MPKTITVLCPTCQEMVSALVLLTENGLEATVLDGDADVRVMHTAATGDHVWNLSPDERKTLRNAIAKGVV
jgi:hypothetical protein